jgi:hypothetical protein
MSFKKNKFLILRKVLQNELINFIKDYFLLKRRVARTLFDTNYISQYSNDFGVWNDKQVPETYSHYADIVMETLLEKVTPILEKNTKIKLIPNYSYARIYKKGDVLKRHKDRFSCEISITLNLGGDPWPIYLSPKENVGIPDGKKITMMSNAKGIKVDLRPGDMLIYKGRELEHWRESFKGENCIQVFLHYNTKDTSLFPFDGRPHLGLPMWFRKKTDV